MPSLIFISLVLGLLFGLLRLVIILDRRHAPIIGFVAIVWLGLHGLLALSGFYADFSTVPPRLALVLAPMTLVVIAVARTASFDSELAKMSLLPLVLFQSFRVLMEAILYVLVDQHRLATMMSFHGSNFDGVVGVTAPLIAMGLCKYGERFRRVAIAWNLLGFAILMNTVVHGVLSVPTVLQIYFTDPPNTLMAEFPWIWLPAFVVPCALIGHILSIKQLIVSSSSKN